MITSKQIQTHISGAMRDFRKYRKYGDIVNCPKGQYVFQDNGADVLAVCHLDVVQWNKKPRITLRTIKDCPQLDDRLGAAVLCEWLPQIGKFDLLFCDLEESAQSTAQYFAPPRQYRYAVEFDRAGSDCVLYQYDDGKLADTLECCGIEIGRGSFSDIAFLDCGCECVNWGIGYHGQHTNSCYANLCEVNSQLAKFANWYQWFGHREFPYSEPPAKPWTTPNKSASVTTVDCRCYYCGGHNDSAGLDLLCSDCRVSVERKWN